MASVRQKDLIWTVLALVIALFLWETLGLAAIVDRFRPGK